ncbi:hypothetical protein ACOMHN_064737 [Nucella lapillus]
MQTRETLNRQEDTLRRFKTDQEAIYEKSIADLCQDVKDTKQGVQQNTEAINQALNRTRRLQHCWLCGDGIESAGGFSRRNNMKLFGVPESTGEEQEDCAEVVRYVLETYIPEKTWDPDVIKKPIVWASLTPTTATPVPSLQTPEVG